MTLTDYEKETIILFNEEEGFISIYTSKANWKNTLSKFADSHVDRKDGQFVTYHVPKEFFSVDLSNSKKTVTLKP